MFAAFPETSECNHSYCGHCHDLLWCLDDKGLAEGCIWSSSSCFFLFFFFAMVIYIYLQCSLETFPHFFCLIELRFFFFFLFFCRFIHVFLGLGAALCGIACFGHFAAHTANLYCLSSVSFLFNLLHFTRHHGLKLISLTTI